MNKNTYDSEKWDQENKPMKNFLQSKFWGILCGISKEDREYINWSIKYDKEHDLLNIDDNEK